MGEGCQGQTGQPSQFAHRSGGDSGDGMRGREARVTQETCLRGENASTSGTTSEKKKAVSARAGVRVPHSSLEAPESGVERRRGSCAEESKTERERGDGPQGIATPTVPETATGVRKLQRTLYRQAKSKPKWKAWSLYADVCRREVLEAALEQVTANGGAPGIDGQRVESLKERKDGNELRERWLAELQTQLRDKTYRPSPVRRVHIPKANGKVRPLGIPTVRDRVVQTAVVLLLLPVFEADFHENSYAYRPRKRAQQAIDAIKEALLSGRREVVDADLSGYFDTIPHAELMRLVKGRVSDGSILRLIKGWLRAPVVEEDAQGGRRMRANRCGTPQGGVISPLLANLYLDGLDKAVNTGREMQAVMVRYADDFVVLCRKGRGAEVYRRLKLWLERRKLKLNEEKTRVVNFEEDELEFLGFQLSWRKGRSGRKSPHCEPSAKSAHKLREAVREDTARDTLWKQPEEVIQRINQRMRGWAGYFHYGNSTRVLAKLQWYVEARVGRWLWKKHAKIRGRFAPEHTREQLTERHGLYRMPHHAAYGKS